jgi:aminopeptidase-like protein
MQDGKKAYNWAKHIFPLNRSLTGEGVSKTLVYFKKICSDLKIRNIKSGTKVFDWRIPSEWNVKEAYISNLRGKKIIDFKKNNLHLVGYSQPINKILNYKSLKKHLYSLKSQPNAIPYITSYYKKDWGFCISHKEKKLFKKGKYKVVIDSNFKKGNLKYGEIYFKGKKNKEILISTNICHPSMGNNETSGPVVSLALAKWIKKKKNKNYSYRILFLPETIGALGYLKKNIKKLKQNLIAGFQIVCVGDDKHFSFLQSKKGNTLADCAARYVLKTQKKKVKYYSFLRRGSDERQYNSPGIDLPVCSIMKSKYGEYPEYHTSLDDLKFISAKGLSSSIKIYKEVINLIESTKRIKIKTKTLGEPMLSRHKLYPLLSTKKTNEIVKTRMNVLAYANGKFDLIQIAEIINEKISKVLSEISILKKKKIIKVIK